MDHILIVDEDSTFCKALAAEFNQFKERFQVSQATSEAGFHNLYEPYKFNLVILNPPLKGSRNGMTLLNEMMKISPYQVVIMIVQQADTKTHIDAIKCGAQLYLNKNEFQLKDIVQMAEVILTQSHLQRRVENYEPLDLTDMVIESEAMKEVQKRISLAAFDSHTTVLVRGETGTGKELVAKNIHYNSRWHKNGPFVTASLVGLNDATINSELFGHERGAFTGATEQHRGYFEEANGGTLFLDEIGELDLKAQAKLLRVLQERKIQRMGSIKEIPVDFQLITATNRDLEAMVKCGKFREELYYRLLVFEICIPPLRDRQEDIIPLAESCIGKLHTAARTPAAGFNPKTIEYLGRYNWPGNVRELLSVVEFAAINALAENADFIQPWHLPSRIVQQEVPTSVRSTPTMPSDFHQWLARAEIEMCANAIEGQKITQIKLADRLGYHDRYVFQRRLRKAFEIYPEAKDEFPDVAKLFR
ncbi:MAG: sigma-54-dependent Fis family transcriptional regulator [Kiritimatiellae bacterium]|nr:sigma-54-dependent Fis family transcriptional regulator [Kiritimatiellia bacterium]